LSGELSIPKFVSDDGRDLIRKILNIDPQKRFTISDIRMHPWFNLYSGNQISSGILVGLNKIPID
jgi:serine/threonine protein kinase